MTTRTYVESVFESPAVQEALYQIDAALRPAVLQALTAVIREAQHDERIVCAKIAVAELRAAEARRDGRCEDVADRIAAAIVQRDVAAA